MANISREDDARDFDERRRNNGQRPNVAPPPKSDKERMADLDAELERLRWKLFWKLYWSIERGR